MDPLYNKSRESNHAGYSMSDTNNDLPC